MDQPVDVPYATIQMMPDLTATMSGEATGSNGERYMIQRYVSKTTGKVYECVFPASPAVPKCAEMKDAETPPK